MTARLSQLLPGAIHRADSGPEVRFGVRVRNHDRERTPPLVRLKAVCGPGDLVPDQATFCLSGR